MLAGSLAMGRRAEHLAGKASQLELSLIQQLNKYLSAGAGSRPRA